jgi:hypothetical protein
MKRDFFWLMIVLGLLANLAFQSLFISNDHEAVLDIIRNNLRLQQAARPRYVIRTASNGETTIEDTVTHEWWKRGKEGTWEPWSGM